MASLRQGPNLRRLLCKATLPKLTEHQSHSRDHQWLEEMQHNNWQAVSHLPPDTSLSCVSDLSPDWIHSHHTITIKLQVWKRDLPVEMQQVCLNFTINTMHNTITSTDNTNINNKQRTTYCGMTKRKFANRCLTQRLCQVWQGGGAHWPPLQPCWSFLPPSSGSGCGTTQKQGPFHSVN